MARTQAVYNRDSNGTEPPKRAAKIDEFVEEYLNGQPPAVLPPAFPITSQIEGELRELRMGFANTRYRILYQRSENLVVLLDESDYFVFDSARVPAVLIGLAVPA